MDDEKRVKMQMRKKVMLSRCRCGNRKGEVKDEEMTKPADRSLLSSGQGCNCLKVDTESQGGAHV